MDQRYQVIARKYRPQTFKAVYGQDNIVTTLKNSLKHNRSAHAYLFCGCRGTGKTTLARVYAKALNCQALTEDFEPCNTCQSCVDITLSKSLDVIEIDGASHRGIDDIRQINETIGYAPSNGKYKIYIIDEVHMLTKEAFNALLKTLEEPPKNVKFFFATTEPHKVLATIVSRCQRFDLNRISFDLISKKLIDISKDLGIAVEESAIRLIASFSEGALRDAESLFDQVICSAEGTLTYEHVITSLGITPSNTFFELDSAIVENNLAYGFKLTDSLFSSGKDISYFIDSLMNHYRNYLKLKLSPSSESLLGLNSNELTHYKKYAALFSEEDCLYILDYLGEWAQKMQKAPFKKVHLEMLLLHLIRSKHRLSLDSLVRELKELKSQAGQVSVATPVAPVKPVVAAPKDPVQIKEPVVEEKAKSIAKTPTAEEAPKVIEATPLSLPIEELTPAPVVVALAPSPSAVAAPVSTIETISPPSLPVTNTVKYDTVVRFAAVELEGTVTN